MTWSAEFKLKNNASISSFDNAARSNLSDKTHVIRHIKTLAYSEWRWKLGPVYSIWYLSRECLEMFTIFSAFMSSWHCAPKLTRIFNVRCLWLDKRMKTKYLLVCCGRSLVDSVALVHLLISKTAERYLTRDFLNGVAFLWKSNTTV